jgi:hypothetical protein
VIVDLGERALVASRSHGEPCMTNRLVVRVLLAVALAVVLQAPSARAELAAWDPSKVLVLAKNLAEATAALEQAFAQQPAPTNPQSLESGSYHRLKHRVRMLGIEARVLATSLEQGEGRDQTELSYDMLMSHARSARYEASLGGVGKDVSDRASAVRRVLNELGPYYDPDFRTLAPDPRIEPGAAR